MLFLLAWLAQKGGTSILVAGFGAGVMVALIGGPKRLSTQVRGIADGFFVPLYFVVLGASLDLGGLVEDPTMIGLVGCAGGAERRHPRARRGTRAQARARSRWPPRRSSACPAAVASLGLSEHLISPVTATAIVASALHQPRASARSGVDLLAKQQEPDSRPASAAGAPAMP